MDALALSLAAVAAAGRSFPEAGRLEVRCKQTERENVRIALLSLNLIV